MAGTADLDGGFVVLDLHRFYGINMTPKLMRSATWQFVLGRAYSLLNIDDSLTAKEARRGV